MSQYYTDFSEYSTGTPPSDWTIDSGTWTVVSESAGTGGQVYEVTSSGITTWDDTSGTDMEVVCKTRVTSGDSQQGVYSQYDRSNGDFFLGDYYNRFDSDDHRIRDQSGKLSDASGVGIDATTWFWIRIRRNSNDVKSKIWQDGNQEPSTWTVTTTDSATVTGYPGLNEDLGSTVQYDKFGVGTNGDTAPSTSPAPAAPSGLNATVQ